MKNLNVNTLAVDNFYTFLKLEAGYNNLNLKLFVVEFCH